MEDSVSARLDGLEDLIGRWSIEAVAPWAPPGELGKAVFEWGPQRGFAVERWQVPQPQAPDGLAVIAADPDDDRLVQHYFDSRGVVRRYEMEIGDGAWNLTRMHPGFSQRFRGRFSADGNTIEGAWEGSKDGLEWSHDFRLIYRRID